MPTLHFKGKQLVQNHHLVVPFHELKPVKAKSVLGKDGKVSLHDNVIMHGDNLAALKALLPTHQGKIKCIYIDPPYNTGNEGWVYNDNVNDPMLKEWLGKAVDKEDLTRHDKWLCMMWPRLRLLRELLSDEGSIWISLDDNEKHNLLAICNEIFGEDNFVACITVRANPRGRQSDSNIATLHDYLICYAKRKVSLELNGVPLGEDLIEEYDNEDSDGKKWRELGLRQRGAASLREERPDMYFPIFVNPNDGTVSLQRSKIFSEEVFPRKSDGRDGRWSWGKEKVKNETDRVYGRKVSGRGEYDIFIKDFLDRPNGQRQAKPKTIWNEKEVNTEAGGKLLKEIFGKATVFPYPKPLGLLHRVIQIATQDGDIVLDSFAGSGTTAHAVLARNKEDGGNRKFVLIETLDYADTITAERVRRVIKGVPKAKDEALKEGLGGTFSYFELGKPVEIQTILNGKNLPPYKELARYVFFMATGEEWNEKELDAKKNYIGESRNYHVYLFYQPDVGYLKNTALTHDHAKALPDWKFGDKRRLIFAPTKYLDQDFLDQFGLDFARLPYEIYQLAGGKKKAGD